VGQALAPDQVFVSKLGAIDKWRCVKSFGARVVTGGSMVARQVDWLPLRKPVVPTSSETEVKVVESGGQSL
jgi:hypothetical protein